MPDTNKQFHPLLGDIQRVLTQEKELFGGTLYTNPEPPATEQEAHAMAAHKKTIPIVEGPDLFGFKPPAAESEQKLPPYPDEPWVAAKSLDELNSMICNCVKCSLGNTRIKFVFGVGNPDADIVFIGEAPGADEDARGEPFVGRAGQLLNKILEAVHFKREEVYICNILKCRPPGNRNPEPDEIACCEQYLFRQIAAVKPKVICALGAFGAQTLLKTTETIGRLRGQLIDYRGSKLMATFHPAYLLRNPNEKRRVWEDMQIVRDYLLSLRNPDKSS